MKADYKTMDIEKAIETWNVQRGNDGHDRYDDLYIFDNDRDGLDTIFCDIYDALVAASLGKYDIQDDYIYINTKTAYIRLHTRMNLRLRGI